MKTDIQGCSVCQAGKEQYETVKRGRINYIQYDYRTPDGELFSTVAPNLQICRNKRDEWLNDRNGKGS